MIRKLRSHPKQTPEAEQRLEAATANLPDPVDLETCDSVDADIPRAVAGESTEAGSLLGSSALTAITGLMGTAMQKGALPHGEGGLEPVNRVEPQLGVLPQQRVTTTETPPPPLQPKRQSDGIDENGMVKRRRDMSCRQDPPPIVTWSISDVGIDNVIRELQDSYENLPPIRSVRDLAEDPTTEVHVCKLDLWRDAANRFPDLSVEHLSAIVQLPKFMGYINPARSLAMGIKLAVLGSGYASFKGLVKSEGGVRSPVKMISYGVVKHSQLAEPKEVHMNNTNTLFVKSISIFPLPGEWERTVGFIGTCANAAQLLFSPFQGALSYSTRMVPAPSPGAHSTAAPRYSGSIATPRTTTGVDPAGLPLPWDEIPVYDARALCTNEVDIEMLMAYEKDNLEQLGNADIPAGSFVGVVHCVKWINSVKHTGKERVQLSIAEIYLLADPEINA